MKTIWKNIASRVWLIVTPIVLAILIAFNVLASVTFFDAIATVLGRATTKIVGDEMELYETDDGINDKTTALANGNAVSKEICEEGFVLLKNEDGALPLTAGKNVSIFGKNSVNLAVGGSGSGGGVEADYDLYDSLEAAGFNCNPKLEEFYNDDSKSGSGRSANPSDLDSGNVVTLDIGETPIASYTQDIWDSCASYKDAALIVLTRIGGEGFDMPRLSDGTHSLQLSDEENALIDKVTALGFGKVVIVINAVTTVELKSIDDNDEVDAILWIGYTGGQGILALGEILTGAVTPSGKTVDTWATTFSHSPVWANFGAALDGDSYKIATKDARTGRDTYIDEKVYFVDYEEGIYVGYRYYETRYADYNGPIVEVGEDENLLTADDWYENEVVYPFGYGLSYTTFDWELINADEVSAFDWSRGESLTFKVKVRNTGEYAGRDVVELYVTAPYYGSTDADGNVTGIEKSAKTLVGFAKTDLLQPKDEDTVEITVDSPYNFASYDYNDANDNGFKGYETEHGTYIFTLGTDAHNAKSEDFIIETTLKDDIRYETASNLFTDCDNQRDDSDAELDVILSRADFAGTWPEARTTAEKVKSTEWIDSMKADVSVTNRPVPEGGYTMPTTGKNNGITLDMLIGVDYDDELWDKFMDQLTVNEMTSLLNQGAFHTTAIQRLQVPQTTSSDGPAGYVNFIGAPEIYDTCSYPSEVVVASTWNMERVYDMGRAVGNEALIGNYDGDGAPYSGWYAPGLNIHRSPFGGRNYEYFSEDSYLSGIMTAAIIEGCADKGVYVTIKHFALNDQETHRGVTGLLTWATEQSIREIYLKPFEIAIKTAQEYEAVSTECGEILPLAVMTSFNRVGERWAGGDYRLLTTILRGEWSFKGLVISDFNTCTYMNVKDMIYAGGDLNLEMAGLRTYTPDKNSAADITVFREAAKNVLYVVANSNAMRGEFIMVPPMWQILVFVADGIIIVGLAAWGAAVIVRALRKKKIGKVRSDDSDSTAQYAEP